MPYVKYGRGEYQRSNPCFTAYAFQILERNTGGKKSPSDAKRLAYTNARASVGLTPMQREILWRISIARFLLAIAVVHGVPHTRVAGNYLEHAKNRRIQIGRTLLE
jgi:hypothetical protein